MDSIKYYELKDSLKEKCWRLTSYVFAQYDNEELSHPWKENWCIFENDLQEMFDTNFYKELIELAGLVRALMDVESITVEDDKFDISVGWLQNDGGEFKPLTYREACNKIIHASKYEVSLKYDTKHPLDNGKSGYEKLEGDKFKNPIVTTIGSFKGGKKWTSKINFIKFIEQTINLPN